MVRFFGCAAAFLREGFWQFAQVFSSGGCSPHLRTPEVVPFWKNLQSKWHLLQRQLAVKAGTKAYKTDEIRMKTGHFASKIDPASAQHVVIQAFLQFAEAQELP